MDRPENLSELLKAYGAKIASDVHVCFPARIISYNQATKNCDIKPIASKVIGRADIPLPIIQDVPVCFPRSSSFILEYPINIGDVVTVLVPDRGIDNLRSGSDTPVFDRRNHSITDAIAIPSPIVSDNQQTPLTRIIIDSSGAVTIESPSSVFIGGQEGAVPAALSTSVMTELTKLHTTLNSLSAAFTAAAPLQVGPAATAGAAFTAFAAAITATLVPPTPSPVSATKTRIQ
jgi:hypothetical protein